MEVTAVPADIVQEASEPKVDKPTSTNEKRDLGDLLKKGALAELIKRVGEKPQIDTEDKAGEGQETKGNDLRIDRDVSDQEAVEFQGQLQELLAQFKNERELTEEVRNQSWAVQAVDRFSRAVHTLTENKLGNAATVGGLVALTALSQIHEMQGVEQYFNHLGSLPISEAFAAVPTEVVEGAKHAATVAGGILIAEGPLTHISERTERKRSEGIVEDMLGRGSFSPEQLHEIFTTKEYASVAIPAQDFERIASGETMEDSTNPYVSLFMKSNEASASLGRMGQGMPMSKGELQRDRQKRAQEFLTAAISVQQERRSPATMQREVITKVGKNIGAVAGIHVAGPILGLGDDIVPLFRPLSRMVMRLASGITSGGSVA